MRNIRDYSAKLHDFSFKICNEEKCPIWKFCKGKEVSCCLFFNTIVNETVDNRFLYSEYRYIDIGGLREMIMKVKCIECKKFKEIDECICIDDEREIYICEGCNRKEIEEE